MASTNYKLVSVCEEMNPRRRNTMEDVHRVVPVLGGREDLSYLAVYDGHGGTHIYYTYTSTTTSTLSLVFYNPYFYCMAMLLSVLLLYILILFMCLLLLYMMFQAAT